MQQRVIWSEGLFLQPQHFQQQERFLLSLMRQYQQAVNPVAWGFSQLQLQQECLNLGKIAISSCQGIFADGTTFSIPAEDALPQPLQIANDIENTIVVLAIPITPINHSNRYKIIETQVMDCHTDSDKTASLEVGQVNCHIRLHRQDLHEVTYLPFARIKEVRPNNQILLDPNFIPPYLNVHNQPVLQNWLIEIQGMIQQRAQMLAQRLNHGSQSPTLELNDTLILQTMNRFSTLFSHYLHNALHPEKLFCDMQQLVAELATFTSDNRLAKHNIRYNHYDLSSCLNPVTQQLRNSLNNIIEQNAVAIELNQQQHGFWLASIDDHSLFSDWDFVLAVYAESPAELLRKHFSTLVKIAATDQIEQLIKRALSGVEVELLAIAPRQIPYHTNFVYYQLNKNHPNWSGICQSQTLAIHIGAQLPKLKLELWAIRG